MRATHITAVVVAVLGFGTVGCQSSPHSTLKTASGPASEGSVFRVESPAGAPVASDQPILIKCWSVDLLDPTDPDAAALLGDLPRRMAQVEGRFDPDAIASHLESLDAKQQLHLRSMPMIIVRGGEGATIKITEPIDRPDLQAGLERGEAMFPFEVGERYEVQTAFDDDGFILLDINYSRESLTGDIEEPLPSVMTCRIQHTVRLRSGESIVLGGWRSYQGDAGDRTEEVAQIVVLNARALLPVSMRQSAAR
ncbi:MAG: hypothetical protein Q9O74_01380 [Planctomycetota bacterium]|nr:hypothetical protein [Planctomycetota bacterium]